MSSYPADNPDPAIYDVPHPDASAEDFNAVWKARPASPVGDQPITVSVVGQRCVYVNDFRIAGGKPYLSEGLPSHQLKTTLADVLNAFPDADILAALEEKRAHKEYFAAFHARKAALKAQSGEPQ